ncbi:MAG: hypothetical protein SGJ10_05740 [Bacteroidota bacterium]|nr:hypothetical protein [Bacteroidota bacterium]
MQTLLLYSHSWLRWVYLILALVVVVRSVRGWRMTMPFTAADNKFSLFYMITADIMFLMGMVQYWVYFYPQVMKGKAMGEIMKEASIRVIGIEHITLMTLAWIFVHIARSKSKKAKTDNLKHKHLFVWSAAALLFVLAGIPWARDLFKF